MFAPDKEDKKGGKLLDGIKSLGGRLKEKANLVKLTSPFKRKEESSDSDDDKRGNTIAKDVIDGKQKYTELPKGDHEYAPFKTSGASAINKAAERARRAKRREEKQRNKDLEIEVGSNFSGGSGSKTPRESLPFTMKDMCSVGNEELEVSLPVRGRLPVPTAVDKVSKNEVLLAAKTSETTAESAKPSDRDNGNIEKLKSTKSGRLGKKDKKHKSDKVRRSDTSGVESDKKQKKDKAVPSVSRDANPIQPVQKPTEKDPWADSDEDEELATNVGAVAIAAAPPVLLAGGRASSRHRTSGRDKRSSGATTGSTSAEGAKTTPAKDPWADDSSDGF